VSRGRFDRVRRRLDELGLDALLLSTGADLPWLTGYTAMPLERLTMLVLPADGEATLVVPRLEGPRVTPRPEGAAVHLIQSAGFPLGVQAVTRADVLKRRGKMERASRSVAPRMIR